MSDGPMGAGWWQASDGLWYPPEQWTGPSDQYPAGAAPWAESASGTPSEADWVRQPADGAGNGSRLPMVLLIAAAVIFVGFASAFLIGSISTGSRGVDPLERMDDLHSDMTAAGVNCSSWSDGISSGTIGPTTVAVGTCVLSGNRGTLDIDTFREESDKYLPDAPCPRVEGEAFWIDTSDVTDPDLVQTLAAALDAEIRSAPC